ncbi:MAG: amidohydrolase, partial [Lysinibacillus sp.]
EHIPTTARVHYAVTNTGGMSPNVVQSQAEVLYLIRSKTIAEVDDIYKRVLKIAEGAALMTETKVTVKFDKACSNYIPNDTINKIIFDKLKEVGLPEYSKEEYVYAEQMASTITQQELMSAKEEMKVLAGTQAAHLQLEELDSPFFEEVIPYEKSQEVMAGSTDVADVSWVIPTAQFFTTCFVLGTPLHTWQLVSQGKTSLGHKGMLYAGKVLAATALELFNNKDAVAQAKQELVAQTKNSYRNPIPKDVQPNMYG